MNFLQLGLVSLFYLIKEKELSTSDFMVNLQNRCGFENKGDIWVQDILNLGVS